MSKKGVSIFFSVIFLLFIAAPTIITIVDDTIDVSVIFSVSEEENQNPLVGVSDFFCNAKTNEFYFSSIATEKISGYVYRNYSIPHLNLISPPPDFI